MHIGYKQLRVLIIDDQAFTRLLIKEVLQSLGAAPEHIFEAEDGGGGLEILKERKVDLIFCDWQMQPMDGLTFVRMLRDPEKSKNPYVPVIFCSAYTERELIERARDTGVSEIMAKPITVKAVHAKIEEILKRPRDFIESDRYFGPDRRRRSDRPATKGERRKARAGTGPPARPDPAKN